MGREGAVDIMPAGWDLREPTGCEALAILRMGGPGKHGEPGVRGFMAAEGLCDRRHGSGCLPALDEGGLGEEWRRPGHCEYRAGARRAWRLP